MYLSHPHAKIRLSTSRLCRCSVTLNVHWTRKYTDITVHGDYIDRVCKLFITVTGFAQLQYTSQIFSFPCSLYHYFSTILRKDDRHMLADSNNEDHVNVMARITT